MGAFNEQGGLQYSRMIEKNLVDVFVPFLPLERKHVKICVRNELERRNVVNWTEDKVDFFIFYFLYLTCFLIFYKVDFVADQLTYKPPEIKLFSTSGCKRVAQKVDLMLEDMEDIVPVSKNEL